MSERVVRQSVLHPNVGSACSGSTLSLVVDGGGGAATEGVKVSDRTESPHYSMCFVTQKDALQMVLLTLAPTRGLCTQYEKLTEDEKLRSTSKHMVSF